MNKRHKSLLLGIFCSASVKPLSYTTDHHVAIYIVDKQDARVTDNECGVKQSHVNTFWKFSMPYNTDSSLLAKGGGRDSPSCKNKSSALTPVMTFKFVGPMVDKHYRLFWMGNGNG
jgi:hypothetical protein